MALIEGAAVSALLAGLTAAAVCGAAALTGPIDRPRQRGSHRRPVPTAGGLGIVAGGCVGLWAFAHLVALRLGDLRPIAAALGLAAGLGLLGALDDLFDLDARLKLAVQVVASLVFALFIARVDAFPLTRTLHLTLGPILGVAGTTLWLVVVCNAVNFMDGANGLAAGSMAIVFFALGLCGAVRGDVALAGAAFVGAAAQLGFLPWNFPHARLFQGDAGALFSSFLLGALAIIGAGRTGEGSAPIYLAPLALTPFLADVLLTLLRRAAGRKPLLQAHADHLYQRWLAAHGRAHAALSWRVYAIMAAYSAAALGLLAAPPGLQMLGLAAGAGVAATAWELLGRRRR